jgi:hypothetical protein
MANNDKDNEQVQAIVPQEPPNYQEGSPFDGLRREEVVPDSVVGTIQACGLNWEVKTEEVFLKDGRKVPDRRAVLRHEEGDDRGIIIGTAGKLFTPCGCS